MELNLHLKMATFLFLNFVQKQKDYLHLSMKLNLHLVECHMLDAPPGEPPFHRRSNASPIKQRPIRLIIK